MAKPEFDSKLKPDKLAQYTAEAEAADRVPSDYKALRAVADLRAELVAKGVLLA